MKQLKFFSIFVAIMVTAMFTGCDKSEIGNSEVQNNLVPKQKTSPAASADDVYSDEEIRNSVFLKGQGITVENPLEFKQMLGQCSLAWYIARPKTGCKDGFGFCGAHLVDTYNINLFDDYCVYMPADNIDWNNVVLELASPSILDMQYVNFVIENDIEVFDKNGAEIAMVYAGNYEYNSDIGEFGGYSLNSVGFEYSNDEIMNGVTLEWQGKFLNSLSASNQEVTDILNASVIFKCQFGKPNWEIPEPDCDIAFGICIMFILDNPQNNMMPFDDDALYWNADEVDWNNLTLKLAEPSELDMPLVKFKVYEDITVLDNKGNAIAIIYADNYYYDANVGSFGGYVLRSVAL